MMENIKTNKGKMNIIFILLAVIIIFGIILMLKVTGVIKPKEVDVNEIKVESNVSNEKDVYEDFEEGLENSIRVANRNATLSTIVSLIISIGLNIGVCKLYKELELPNYIVIFNFIYPILSIVNDVFPDGIKTFVSLIYSVMGILSLGYYFKSLGMSVLWAVLPFASMFFLGFGTAALLFGGGSFIVMLALVAFVAFIIAYIISNIKLAQKFDKGTGFTVGLVLLPFIFQPILGYQQGRN